MCSSNPPRRRNKRHNYNDLFNNKTKQACHLLFFLLRTIIRAKRLPSAPSGGDVVPQLETTVHFAFQYRLITISLLKITFIDT